MLDSRKNDFITTLPNPDIPLKPDNRTDKWWATGVLNLNTFLGLFFTLFLFYSQMNGGQTGDEIWVYIEFIAARLPTLQILGEKKVLKIPEI